MTQAGRSRGTTWAKFITGSGIRKLSSKLKQSVHVVKGLVWAVGSCIW